MKTARFAALLAGAALALLAGCSSSSSKGAPAATPSTAFHTRARAAGPVATVEPLSGGAGPLLVAAPRPTVASTSKRVEEEYSVAGTAVSYKSVGALPTDGSFHLVTDGSAAYKTRILVRRPAAASDFNGTVVVEWLNVSAGFDAAPDYTYMADEINRKGYAWVGVSAQRVGIEGGPVAVSTPVSDQAGAGKGLRALDPARYASLHHPGDAFSYDIFTQVARTLRSPGKVDPLGGLKPKLLLAVGESQSAFALTTYADGVQPLAGQFDGILIHSRGGAAAPLGEPGKGIDIAGTIGLPATKIRTDLTVPVMVVETETDVLGILKYFPARQPDTDHLRVWEVAGTAHADAYQLGSASNLFDCGGPINAGPDHYIVASALRHLDTWAAGGAAPPEAKPLATKGGAYVRDADGIVEGGIRTPLVDVPVDVLTGEARPGGSIACLLSGATDPLPPARIKALYPSRAAYLADFTKSADAAVKAGFVLPEDRAELLSEAKPDRVAG